MFILKLLILVILYLECYVCFHITRNPFKGTKGCASVGNKEFIDHELENETPTNFKDISEIESNFWQTKGQKAVKNHLKRRENKNVAENVIFFIGDGMSLTTVAAARIYAGQLKNKTGEEMSLSFEQFPHTGLSKTYCIDRQVADSASTGTALFTGVKTNYKVIGVNGKVLFNDCAAAKNKLNHVSSILDWAQKAGKATGLVTDTKITSATPAAAYAHSASRKFECDSDVLKEKRDPIQCMDIARQLIDNNPGKKLNVIFGGGRAKFLPESENKGKRKDSKNLIEDWLKKKQGKGIYISDRKDLLLLNTNNVTHVLGLFATSNLPFKYQTSAEYPSLVEMTLTAIKILNNIKPSNGYVLLVEGGRIDHAHHDNAAHVALEQTVELSEAVNKTIDMINPKNTLVVVTSDHGHTMSFAGYNRRGADILAGITTKHKKRQSSYPILSYANGPGYRNTTDILKINYTNTDVTFQYPATVPLQQETHGGEDVGVYAIGPWSHLFTGVYEQNVIPHLIAYAACIGDGVTYCAKMAGHTDHDVEFIDHELDGDMPTNFKDVSEIESNFWQTKGQQAVENHLKRKQNVNAAENVIFFIGDGMSLTTVAAARIYAGQLKNKTGEEMSLSFEQFPHTGLSKTYCIDRQVADSASTGTALFTGVKTNYKVVGVNGKVLFNDCAAAKNKLNHVSSILDWAQKAGKATGLVTDTKITSATPAAAYAHSASRKFECDSDILDEKQDPTQCMDIARQLIDNNPGKKLNVIFGGGRGKFLPESETRGKRKDSKNLIEEWLKKKNGSGIYISDRKGLLSLNTNNVTHVLGLFAPSNLPFKYEASDKHPSLDEMTSTAIKILKNIKPSNGYLLLVEGGRIDHAHHDNAAHVALEQTVELSEAVNKALDMINTKNTLVVVTSDHGHTMSFAGYNRRGADILAGITTKHKKRRLSYPILSYANGPGYRNTTDILDIDYTHTDVTFQYPATVPLQQETHGGEDVGVYAIGPWSHLFTGVYEQNVIPHLIAYAACIGDGVTSCGKTVGNTDNGSNPTVIVKP